jgi:hypothetical protein
VHLHYNKMRGPGFEPMTFQIERITTPKLTDSKGRLIPTVRLGLISDSDESRRSDKRVEDENRVLAEYLAEPNLSLADIAIRLGWTFANGDPAKSRVQRIVERVAKAKPSLLKQRRNDKYELTEHGKTVARAAALEFAQIERQQSERAQQTALEF